MNEGTVRIHGAVELERAFRALNKDLGSGIREALENAAEPVKTAAQNYARTQISGMARQKRVDWSEMRIASKTDVVWVAPVQRGRRDIRSGKRRRKFADILVQPMEQALTDNRDKVENSVLQEMDDLFRAWERLGG